MRGKQNKETTKLGKIHARTMEIDVHETRTAKRH